MTEPYMAWWDELYKLKSVDRISVVCNTQEDAQLILGIYKRSEEERSAKLQSEIEAAGVRSSAGSGEEEARSIHQALDAEFEKRWGPRTVDGIGERQGLPESQLPVRGAADPDTGDAHLCNPAGKPPNTDGV